MEAELERRMCDQDEAFELKWAQRVAEANADRDAFRGKLAKLEGEMETVKISEERARSELTLAKRQIDELQLRLARAPIRARTARRRAHERSSRRRRRRRVETSSRFLFFHHRRARGTVRAEIGRPVVDA